MTDEIDMSFCDFNDIKSLTSSKVIQKSLIPSSKNISTELSGVTSILISSKSKLLRDSFITFEFLEFNSLT